MRHSTAEFVVATACEAMRCAQGEAVLAAGAVEHMGVVAAVAVVGGAVVSVESAVRAGGVAGGAGGVAGAGAAVAAYMPVANYAELRC